ncbi:hypothetical protein ABID95_008059 [Streptomyces atratus]
MQIGPLISFESRHARAGGEPILVREGSVGQCLDRCSDRSALQPGGNELHLDQRANQASLLERAGHHTCRAQGQAENLAQDSQDGDEPRRAVRKAKLCRPMLYQQGIPDLFRCRSARVLLAPPIGTGGACAFGAPPQLPMLDVLANVEYQHATTVVASRRDLYPLSDHRAPRRRVPTSGYSREPASQSTLLPLICQIGSRAEASRCKRSWLAWPSSGPSVGRPRTAHNPQR